MNEIEGPITPRKQLYYWEYTLRLTKSCQTPSFLGPLLYASVANAFFLAGGKREIPEDIWLVAPEPSVARRLNDSNIIHLAVFASCLTVEEAWNHRKLLDRGLQMLGSLAEGSGVLGGNFVSTSEQVVRIAPLEAMSGEANSNRLDEATRDAKYRLKVRFKTPTRIRRNRLDYREGHSFLDSDLFEPTSFVKALERRLVAIGSIMHAKLCTQPNEIEITENDLRWVDVGYGPADKRKVFGGVLGEIEITTNCRVTAWLLRMGQLFGVGELTRMGFGRYEIISCRTEPQDRMRVKLIQTPL